jgi:transposase
MAIADATGIPLSVWTTGASTHEVKLVEKTIEKRFIKEKPKRIIGDRAYDSDPLDKRLKKKKIKLIAPHKRNRKKQKTQDGREFKRYCRRWKIERLFAWIQNYRRCVTRYEYKAENYLAFVQIACTLIMTKHF